VAGSRATNGTPTVLLVEHRDEVFARLAADLALAGVRVVRAECALEAVWQYCTLRPKLVVANVDLPCQSGWLLAAKLGLAEPRAHTWLYKPWKNAADLAMAKFVRAEELLQYRGNLYTLSDAVLDCLPVVPRLPPHPGTCYGKNLSYAWRVRTLLIVRPLHDFENPNENWRNCHVD